MDEVKTYQGQSLWVCPACGNREYRPARYVPVPEERRLYKGQEERLPEYCPHHHTEEQGFTQEMVWTPESSAHDLLGESFIVDLDGVQTKLSSLHELRALENLSLRKAANGDGSPSIFRRFSQDHSNRDVNALRGSHLEKNRQIPFARRTNAGAITAAAIEESKARRR